jgi:GT2 family glycosyltransferase
MNQPTVSVVCLSFNRPHLVRGALESIRAQSLRPLETILVDNRSERSGEVAGVAAEYPEVRLIANSTNLGFTGGMNTGLREAIGDYVVLTEDDITLHPDAVRQVVGRLQANPQVGIVGGLMLNKTAGTIRCAGGRVTLGPRFQMQVIGENEPDDGQFAEPFPVTYLPGAFLAARRAVWARLGGFRERYFAYMEDIDLCVRAEKTGLTLEVVPAARVWHADPPVGGAMPEWLHLLRCQNLFRVYLLNARGPVLPAFFARYGVWQLVRTTFTDSAGGQRLFRALLRTFGELPSILRDRRLAHALPRIVRG